MVDDVLTAPGDIDATAWRDTWGHIVKVRTRDMKDNFCDQKNAAIGSEGG